MNCSLQSDNTVLSQLNAHPSLVQCARGAAKCLECLHSEERCIWKITARVQSVSVNLSSA